MTDLEKVKIFWQWFESQAEVLLKITSFDIIDELAEQLATVDPGITAEVSNYKGDSDREFVITSHGDQSKFGLILEMVKMAPEIMGWRFQALKPPRGFSFQVGGKIGLSIRDWRFIPLKASPEFTEIGLRIEMAEQDCKELDGESLASIIEEGVGEVLLSLCAHIEHTSSITSNAISIDSLAETLYSWALTRGPKSLHHFLPEIELA